MKLTMLCLLGAVCVVGTFAADTGMNSLLNNLNEIAQVAIKTFGGRLNDHLDQIEARPYRRYLSTRRQSTSMSGLGLNFVKTMIIGLLEHLRGTSVEFLIGPLEAIINSSFDVGQRLLDYMHK